MLMTRKATASQKGKAVADEGMSRVPMSSKGQSEAPRGNTTPSHSSPISPAPKEIRRNQSNKDEDPQNSIDMMQRTLRVMHTSDIELVELASYRLWDDAVQCYETWELSRGTNATPTVWELFSCAFLHHYLPAKIRQARVNRFLAPKQGNMSVREYSLQFDSLARYAPSIVAELSDRVHRFVVGFGPHLINECFTTSLLYGMNIYRILAYAQNLEYQK
nr:uncharacterized protein LOC117275651 [Nicotiana tomentosiformis]